MRRNLGAVAGVLVAGWFVVGCVGEDGAAGPQGPAGPAGPNGNDGTNGTNGTSGTNGSDGTNGTNGTNGTDGALGPQGPQGPQGPGTRWLSFADVGFARTHLEKHQVRTAALANLDGEQISIGYQPILRSNQDPARPNRECDLVNSPATCVGTLLTSTGHVMHDDGGEPMVSNANDFTSLLDVAGHKFLVNSFEWYPSAIYVTRLHQDPVSGALEAVSSHAVDLADVDGLYRSCAGSITPWNTHISSEEAQVDARSVQAATTWAQLAATSRYGEIKAMVRYLGLDLTDANSDGLPDVAFDSFSSLYTPYFHGYNVEVSVDASGAAVATKHYAMGRLGIELAYVMPDQKTAFITDDVVNGGFFMYAADQAGDLSAGTLYAQRVYQTTTPGGAFRADIEWISLGHASDAEIRAMLHPHTGARTTFNDIFEVANASSDGTCPSDFKAVRATGEDAQALECLRLRPGQELAASRLETRRYANYLGATTELTKEEGLTYDPDLRRLYISLSDVTTSMGAQPGGDNHIDVGANRCGGVYALDLGAWYDASGNLVSDFAPLNWYPLIVGTQMTYPATSVYAGNTCSVGGIASPDNLTYLPKYGVLMIGEDTGRHQNDALWAYHIASGRLTRVMTTPYGSEVTSPYWLPDFGGFGYLLTAVQHPYGESDQARAGDPESTGTASWIGVLGPFPALD